MEFPLSVYVLVYLATDLLCSAAAKFIQGVPLPYESAKCIGRVPARVLSLCSNASAYYFTDRCECLQCETVQRLCNLSSNLNEICSKFINYNYCALNGTETSVSSTSTVSSITSIETTTIVIFANNATNSTADITVHGVPSLAPIFIAIGVASVVLIVFVVLLACHRKTIRHQLKAWRQRFCEQRQQQEDFQLVTTQPTPIYNPVRQNSTGTCRFNQADVLEAPISQDDESNRPLNADDQNDEDQQQQVNNPDIPELPPDELAGREVIA